MNDGGWFGERMEMREKENGKRSMESESGSRRQETRRKVEQMSAFALPGNLCTINSEVQCDTRT